MLRGTHYVFLLLEETMMHMLYMLGGVAGTRGATGIHAVSQIMAI